MSHFINLYKYVYVCIYTRIQYFSKVKHPLTVNIYRGNFLNDYFFLPSSLPPFSLFSPSSFYQSINLSNLSLHPFFFLSFVPAQHLFSTFRNRN